ncbi:MAG: M56 family metallopeptidase, partial [Oscillospiraceae bacterium]|nr:M56 family metallopeptidase [Oscillospiraceae bacterium]
GMIAVLVYALGVLGLLLYYLINYKSYTRLHCRRNRTANAEEYAMLVGLCGRHRVPRLYRNPLAVTPMLIGLFRPAIILPDREYTDAQLHSVLLHELTHLRRKDMLVKWLSVLASAVHWFNPLVWLVRREIDRACELACDEAVIRGLETDGKQSYGDTLISVAADARAPRVVLSTTMCEEKKTLKERLESIMKYKSKSKVIVAVSLALMVVLSACGMVLGASSANKPEVPAEASAARPDDQNTLMASLGYTYQMLETIQENRTPYVGDNAKVGAIVGELPITWKGMSYDSFSLQTDEEPYGLTINYTDNYTTDWLENPFSAAMKENNTLLLFAAISNLEEIRCSYFTPLEQYSELFTRDEIRAIFGGIPSIGDLTELFFTLSDNLKMEEFYFAHASRYYLIDTQPENIIYRQGEPERIVTLPNGLTFWVYNELGKTYSKPEGSESFSVDYVGETAGYLFNDEGLYATKGIWNPENGLSESYSDIIAKFGVPHTEKMIDGRKYISYLLRPTVGNSVDPPPKLADGLEKRAWFLLENDREIESGVMLGDDYSIYNIE